MAAQDNLNDHQFQVAKVLAHPDFAKNLESHRQSWLQTSIKAGVAKPGDHVPLHIWANDRGEIKDSVTDSRLTKDNIIPTGMTFAKDEKWPGKCENCDYYRQQHEEKIGRPVQHQEEYPHWEDDWNHTH